MPADLDTLLRRTAPEPSRPLDVDGLLQRARRRQRQSRLLAGVTAAVAATAMAGVLSLSPLTSVIFEPSEISDMADAPAPPPATPSPADTHFPTSRPEWVLPPAPIDARSGAVAVWTGDEVLVWGGWLSAEMGAHPDQVHIGEQHEDGADPIPIGEVRFDDGAAYSPADGTWRVIASAPFPGGYADQGVWTGTELLVWSSEEDRLAAYDPGADAWSVLPGPPEQAGHPVVTMIWTGSEAVLWGGMDHQPELPAFGAAFDPSTRSWRTLPEAPVAPRQWHSATWTGREMIIFGGSDLSGPIDEELGGATYDPEADTWRALPLAPVGGQQKHVAAWTGTELLVWGGQGAVMRGNPAQLEVWGLPGLAYDPVADAWRILPDAPVRWREEAVAAWTGDALLVWGTPLVAGGTDTASYDPATDTWHALPGSGLSDRCLAATAWTGTALFAWSGLPECENGMPPTDGALIAAAHGLPDETGRPTGSSSPEGEELPEGCRVLPEGERQVSETGLAGAASARPCSKASTSVTRSAHWPPSKPTTPTS